MKTKIFIIIFALLVMYLSFADVVIENNMVSFYFESTAASSVSLIGNFNNWDPFATPMKGEDGEWFVQLKLDPGVYQYAFLINGTKTVSDPNEYGSIKNDLGTYNSVFVLKMVDGKLMIDVKASRDYSKKAQSKKVSQSTEKKEISLPDNYEPNTPKNKTLSPKIVDGYVVFSFKGPNDAKSVNLAGSFNSWNSSALSMNKINGVWIYKLKLNDGIYQYKFVINGSEWKEDPNSYGYAPDGYGGKNSVLIIKDSKIFIPKIEKPIKNAVTVEKKKTVSAGPEIVNNEVIFRFKYPSANKVNLAGTFNNWNQNALPMKLQDGYWTVKLHLDAGSYEYKFVVDGNTWIEDPNALEYVPDPYGGKNSVITLKDENGKLIIVKPSKKSQTSLLKGNAEFKIGASLNSLWFCPQSYNLITLTISPKIPNVTFIANFSVDTAEWALLFNGMELKISKNPFSLAVYNNWAEPNIKFINSIGNIEKETMGTYASIFGIYFQIGNIGNNFYYGIGYNKEFGILGLNVGYFDKDFSKVTFGYTDKTIAMQGNIKTSFGVLCGEADLVNHKFESAVFKFNNDSILSQLSYNASGINTKVAYNYSIGNIINGQIAANYSNSQSVFYLKTSYSLSKENSLNFEGKYINNQIEYNLFYQHSEEKYGYSVYLNNLNANIDNIYNDFVDSHSSSINIGLESKVKF